MHHPVFPTFPLFALYGKDVCICVCVSRPGSSWRERGKKLFLLASTTPAFSPWFVEHVYPCSLRSSLPGALPKTNESRIQNRFQIYARHNTTPSHRIAVCYWRNWGSVFVCPACRSNDSFVSPFPGGHLLFRPFHDLISRWQRVLLRFWARWELKFDPILPPSVFLNNH